MIEVPPLKRPIGSEALKLGPITGHYPAVWVVTTTCAIAGRQDAGEPQYGSVAHAHTHGSWYGLLCVTPNYADDMPTLAHEYAHLLDWPLGRRLPHGPRFRQILTDLGWPSEAERYVGWDQWERADAKARAAKA